MPIEAKLITDPSSGFTQTLTRTRTGWRGERNYLINTGDVELAHSALGLPVIGQAWSVGVPAARVVSIGPPVVMSSRVEATGEGGCCRMPVIYEQESRGGTLSVVAEPGRSWSVLSVASESVTVQYPILRVDDASPGAAVPGSAIANGDGASIRIGSVEARITRCYQSDDLIDYARLISLIRPCKVNAASVQIPPVPGVSNGFIVQPGQALYLGFDVEVEGDVLKLNHSVALAEDWYVRWQPRNGKGEPTGQVVRDTVYESADFGGLW